MGVFVQTGTGIDAGEMNLRGGEEETCRAQIQGSCEGAHRLGANFNVARIATREEGLIVRGAAYFKVVAAHAAQVAIEVPCLQADDVSSYQCARMSKCEGWYLWAFGGIWAPTVTVNWL